MCETRTKVASLPSSVTESFCGVGNPFSLGDPQPAQTALDLGCGAGFDTLLAAQRVGPNGRVIGVDMTPEMLAKARYNASLLGISNVAFVQGAIESIPLPDASVDLVISNGVFNLCSDKPRVLGEILRVLKLAVGSRWQTSSWSDNLRPMRWRTKAPGRTESPVPFGSGRSWRC